MDFELLPRDLEKIKKYKSLYKIIMRLFFDPIDIVLMD